MSNKNILDLVSGTDGSKETTELEQAGREAVQDTILGDGQTAGGVMPFCRKVNIATVAVLQRVKSPFMTGDVNLETLDNALQEVCIFLYVHACPDWADVLKHSRGPREALEDRALLFCEHIDKDQIERVGGDIIGVLKDQTSTRVGALPSDNSPEPDATEGN